MKFKYFYVIAVLGGIFINGCKETDEIFEDPYSGGKPALGIVVNRQQQPAPASGIAGTTVTVQVTGLMPHKDKLSFLFNGQQGEIVEVTDKDIKVKVPEKASSGITAFVVDGELVFGPQFTVTGLVNIDPTYRVTAGTDASVIKIVPVSGGNVILLGAFSNYDNKGVVKPINRIVSTFPDGTWDRSYQSGNGANGFLNGLAVVNNQYFITGGFSGYAQRGDGINNITRTTSAGVIDTFLARTYTGRVRFAPAFNGGTDLPITGVYSYGGKIVATGNFRYYLSRRYDQPSRQLTDSTIIDSVEVRQLIRFNPDGTLDKTWRFDPNAIGYKGMKGKSLPGANGPLLSMMHSDGKLVAYGQFTKFDDADAGYIIRLNADGSIDPSFNVGTGADNTIQNVNYNAATQKYTVVGAFKNFNGKPAANMVVLNYDGSVDETFAVKAFGGGIPFYAKQLSDGLIVIGGSFKTYDTVSRQGFVIINPNGELASGYNNTGNLIGNIYDIYETKSADNKRALLIGGEFNIFNNNPTNNIVRVTIE